MPVVNWKETEELMRLYEERSNKEFKEKLEWSKKYGAYADLTIDKLKTKISIWNSNNPNNKIKGYSKLNKAELIKVAGDNEI